MSHSWHPTTTYRNRTPKTSQVSGSVTEKFSLPDHVIKRLEIDLQANEYADTTDDTVVEFRLPEGKT